jgi:hypothetical protein
MVEFDPGAWLAEWQMLGGKAWVTTIVGDGQGKVVLCVGPTTAEPERSAVLGRTLGTDADRQAAVISALHAGVAAKLAAVEARPFGRKLATATVRRLRILFEMPSMSNGVQSGPPIGVQKGPPWR